MAELIKETNMDMKVKKKKLGIKEKYAHMTRGLDWETTYQPK